MLQETLPLDGLFFDIHGAMSVQGWTIRKGICLFVFEMVGTDVLISTSMESARKRIARLAQNTDLITCYRLAPHEDAIESKKRAYQSLHRLENGKGSRHIKRGSRTYLVTGRENEHACGTGKKPVRANPSVLRDGRWCTGCIYLDVVPMGDEPRNHGVVVAYGDDKEAVGEAAEALAGTSGREDEFSWHQQRTWMTRQSSIGKTRSRLSLAIWG